MNISNLSNRRLGGLVALVAAGALLGPAARAAEKQEAQMLGQWEGLVSHCTGVAPKLAPVLQERTKALFPQTSEDQMEQVRQRGAYKEARAQAVAGLAHESKEQVVKVCNEFAGVDE